MYLSLTDSLKFYFIIQMSQSPTKKKEETKTHTKKLSGDVKNLSQFEDLIKSLKGTIKKNETEMGKLSKDLETVKKENQVHVQEKKATQGKMTTMQKEIDVLKKRPD